MRKNPKPPMIFLPGLMGSMGRDMIPGTGDWSFGVARWIYKPLIDGLEQRGYVLNEDLFICYYDWRKESHEIVDRYLKPMLRKAKEKCPGQSIDILCHSRGGIVARSYIQSGEYDYDIGNLVMIGTPNAGAIDAYYFWSTGEMLNDPNQKDNLYDMIKRGYMWILRKLLNIPWGIENIHEIHQSFPAIQEMLPALDYGDILYYRNGFGDLKHIPRPWIRYHNFKLDEMNQAIALRHLRNRVEGIHVIVGTNVETNECLLVDGKKFIYENQEVIVDHTVTYKGDGTVTKNSAQLPPFDYYEIEKNHHQMVGASLEILQEIYGLDIIDSIEEDEVCETLHFIFHYHHRLKIEKNGKLLLVYQDKKVNTEYEYISEEFGERYVWIALKNIPGGIYTGEMITKDTDLEKLDFIIIGNGVEEELKGREILRQDRASVQVTFTFEVTN
ncbi:hypothetical protein Amet_3624 [Alkaliphilus metalliredigens QYMF]|uniref:Lecithin:cholesterol acyltransferase n=1 Tax=Alkaliphilus metalliredigens (strain QYMF) TaxID=293826 RepID=A6TU78_ALKMQ|nr:hypothetical protein [Alkaliphilus metalliredigens]ABR49746.1 hypothetical protein Amet_3624 [Alkaliphilus metalliredigens QYMF]